MDSSFRTTPVVAYFGGPSLVGIYLIDELLKRGCRVQIFDEDEQTWQKGALLLKSNFGLTYGTGKNLFSQSFDYIFVSTLLPKVLGTGKNNFGHFDQLMSVAVKHLSQQGKIVVALPLICYSKKNLEEQIIFEKYLSKNYSVRAIYIGDVFGRGMDFYDNRPISKILLDCIKKKKIIIPGELTPVYPIKVEDASKEILKVLFSYWKKGETRVASGIVNYGNLFLNLKNYYPDLQHQSSSIKNQSQLLVNLPISINKKIEEKTFEEIISWIKSRVESQSVSPKIIKFTRKHKKMPYKRLKIFLATLAFLLFFLASPFLLLLFSWFTRNTQTAVVAKTMFIKWTYVPLVGQKFVPLVEASGLVEGMSRILNRSKEVFGLADTLTAGVLGKQKFELEQVSGKLYLELDSLYKEASFLESDIVRAPLAKLLVEDTSELVRIRGYINSAKEVVKALPDLISGEKPKIYMVLHQDSGKLRPTGGVISSFTLLTFEKGKLINLEVYETKKSDALLKGFVKPPEAVKNYLKVSNWSMLDSNWDADFIESAKNAEWFLEKELDIKVSGVIGIDESVESITEADFLSTRLLGKKLLDLALERHLQFYLHDSGTQSALSKIGFTGSVSPPNCGVGCPTLWAGLNEANIGQNSKSHEISRFSRFEINIENNKGSYTLAVNFKNNADSEYTSYLRAMSSNKSIYGSIKIIESQKSIFIDPEITGDSSKIEAGVYFELGPGKEKTIIFNWSEAVSALKTTGSSAQIYLRKQAGSVGDKVEIVVKPQSGEIFTDPRFELTNEGTYRYNTELKRDFSANMNN